MTDHIAEYHSMTVTASSPDGNISAIGNNQLRLKLAFRNEDCYIEYEAHELEQQLGAVLEQLESLRLQEVKAMRERSGLRTTAPATPHPDAARRRYRAQLSELAAVGFSRSEVVEIGASQQLTKFVVSINADKLYELDMEPFLSEFYIAYYDMVNDFRAQVREAQQQHLPD